MRRIRDINVNTQETFNEVFKNNFFTYDDYKNIKYYNRILRLDLFSSYSFLDYGCGNGNALSGIKKKYKSLRVFGVDISNFVIDKNRQLFPDCEFLTVEDFSERNMEFDSILSSHTFEHVEDPMFLAEFLLSKAKKNFIIIVPDRDSWAECEQHIWRFDKGSFDKLKPTFKIRGLINRAGNTELLFFWSKNKKYLNFFIALLLFPLFNVFRNNYIGVVKKILKHLDIRK